MPEDLYPTASGALQPVLVLFLMSWICHRATLSCFPRAGIEALLPQALLVYDQEVARQEFKVLAKLVQQVDCTACISVAIFWTYRN